MTTQTQDFVGGAFKQATECFNQTLKTGIEFQEQATKFWSDTLNQSFDQFRADCDRVVDTTVPAAKKNLERFHDVFDAQAKQSIDTLRKAFDAQKDWKMPNVVEQATNAWMKSFEAMRANVDTLTQANLDLVGSCCEAAKKVHPAQSGKTNGKKSAG